MSDPALYGVMAEFDEPEHFLAAIRRTRAAGYERMDAYSPNPIEAWTKPCGWVSRPCRGSC